jgi:hypothetical protein
MKILIAEDDAVALQSFAIAANYIAWLQAQGFRP